MNKNIRIISDNILSLIVLWENRLFDLSDKEIETRRDSQNRSVKELLGHLIDSASNCLHKIVFLQYEKCPFEYPNYSSENNKANWIKIQNYNYESWGNMVMLWKYLNLHLVHVIRNISEDKLDNERIAAQNRNLSLKEIVKGYPEHISIHLNEIETLIMT